MFWLLFQGSLAGFVGGLLLVALSNLYGLKRLRASPTLERSPRVSILVPARNEEANIAPCVRSLLAQSYPSFEVLVLDDDSSDRTWQVLTELAAGAERLRVFRGQAPPAGWLGKHWACHQLSQAADGELLLFTDADTRHHPHALRDAVAALLGQGADLLTAIPRQEVGTWGERLIVPLFPWSIFCFLPLMLAHRWRWPAFSASVGQFMLFRRAAYDRIGGHASVRQAVIDDIALGRRIKAHGLRWRLLDAGGRVRCRMYHGFQEACEGFGKNLFPAFDGNIPLFTFVWLWLLFVFLEPLVVLASCAIGFPILPNLCALAAVAVGLSLLLWGLTHWQFRFPLYLALFYPATVILGVVIAARSMALTLGGKTTWRGRTLAKRP
ncbi:MAG: glycosyltransferase [Anaerolineae bacterium]|nr:glycosyltransferase [Anaerolineae bacterium]